MAARNKPQPKNGASGQSPSPAGRLLAKTLAPLLALLVVVVLVACLAWGLHWSLLRANPFFTLQSIDVQTDGQALTAPAIVDILAEMGYRPGETNVFEIDVRAIRERLEKAAVVESAWAHRVLPDRLVVGFAQRFPVARLHARIPRFIDRSGYVLLPWEAEGFSLLPDIVGVRDPDVLRPGQKIEDEVLLGALDFLRLNEEYGERLDCRAYMLQLDYHPPEKIKVYVHRAGTFRENAQIVVPIRDMRPALNRLAVIVRDRAGLGLPTSFVDVTYQENVPVRE
jgi:cell division septal protein FtsQ